MLVEFIAGIYSLPNIFFALLLIRFFNKKNTVFKEYLEFKRFHSKSSVKLLFKIGIQQKLIFSFLVIVSILLFTLSYITMTQYKQSVLDLVVQNGTSLIKRASNVLTASVTDPIAIGEYFNKESCTLALDRYLSVQ